MGAISPRPCRHVGCPEVVRGRMGFCEAHRLEAKRDEMSRYNREHPERKRSEYGRQRWRTASRVFLLAHPLCADPFGIHGEYTPFATQVDHIQPVKAGGDFWDPDNWQALCRSCHEQKTASERGR